MKNVKKSIDSPDDIDGFDDLTDADKEKVRKAYGEGKVAEADIPETAKKSEDEDEDEEAEAKPKKKRAPPKKKAKVRTPFYSYFLSSTNVLAEG